MHLLDCKSSASCCHAYSILESKEDAVLPVAMTYQAQQAHPVNGARGPHTLAEKARYMLDTQGCQDAGCSTSYRKIDASSLRRCLKVSTIWCLNAVNQQQAAYDDGPCSQCWQVLQRNSMQSSESALDIATIWMQPMLQMALRRRNAQCHSLCWLRKAVRCGTSSFVARQCMAEVKRRIWLTAKPW